MNVSIKYILRTYTYGRHILNWSVLSTGKSGTSAIGIYTSQWSTDQAKDYSSSNSRHASIIFTHTTTLSFVFSLFSSLFLSSYFLSLSALVVTVRVITELRRWWIFKTKKQWISFDMYFVLLTGKLDHKNELFCMCGKLWGEAPLTLVKEANRKSICYYHGFDLHFGRFGINSEINRI